MATLLITHPCFVLHDTGPGHPERADRMRAIDKVLGHEAFQSLKRAEAPLRDDIESRNQACSPHGASRADPVRRGGQEPCCRRTSTATP